MLVTQSASKSKKDAMNKRCPITKSRTSLALGNTNLAEYVDTMELNLALAEDGQPRHEKDAPSAPPLSQAQTKVLSSNKQHQEHQQQASETGLIPTSWLVTDTEIFEGTKTC